MRLKDKVVIITGSTTGIGKAIALACISEGAQVTVHGLENLEGNELINTLKVNATLHIEDLALEGAAQRLVDKTVNTFGKIDVVINNAAMVVSSDIHSSTLNLFRKIFEVNAVAPFALIQAALPFLTSARGSILNIGSVNAYCGEPDLLPYSVSKGALMTMTANLGDSLFREYGVRVNQINPGWVLTENEERRKWEQGLPGDWYKKISPLFAPSGRILSPAEIAAAAMWLISDQCGPISGQIINLEQYPVIGRNLPKNISMAN